MILALDLSLTRTGFAQFSNEGKLLNYGQITPDEKLHNFLKIKYIVDELAPLFSESDNLTVEGIFLNTFAGGFHNVTGFEILARLSGAVINSYLQKHTYIPVIYKATEARKLVGVKGSVQKAEVQLWAIRKFILGTKEIVIGGVEGIQNLEDFDALIDATYAELHSEQIKRPAFKSRMDKISSLIEETTGIGEDCADALLLGEAHVTAIRLKKDSENNK